jgi:long-chain-fatty-acid--CoA ligase ACSBG
MKNNSTLPSTTIPASSITSIVPENMTTSNILETVHIREMDQNFAPLTVSQAFKNTAEKFGSRPALMYQVGNVDDNDDENNSWENLSWSEYYEYVRNFAYGLLGLDLEDRQGVAIIGFNSKEWLIANMAAIISGCVSVGIYSTNSAETCDYVMQDSKSRVVVVDGMNQLVKLIEMESFSSLERVIVYNANESDIQEVASDHKNVISWENFMEFGKSLNEFENTLNNIMETSLPGQCASLIYTSGTTGSPKGVMLSHDNITWTSWQIMSTFNIDPSVPQRTVSYLPLSHVAGQMIDIYAPLITGGCTWFAQPSALKGTLVKTLVDAKPTIFLGVPRVWSKIMEKMQSSAVNISGFKKFVATKSKKCGLKTHYSQENGKMSKPFLWKLWNKLVYNKVREKLGLSECNIFLTGAAPIKIEVLEYFASLNIPIMNIYGMSECSGPMTISYPMNSKTGSAGKVVPFTKVKLIEGTGEICTFGRHVMMGYQNKPEKTAKAIDEEGWLHSGDIGKFDDDGFLHITGRIKELIITEGGENIPPVLIENKIKSELPILSNCTLIGDHRKYLVCLMTLKCVHNDGVPTDQLDPIVINQFQQFGSTSTSVQDAINDKKVTIFIQDGLTRANEQSTSRSQKVQKFQILETDFSIHGGELGPTLKLKRSVVNEKYKNAIEQLYA